MAQKVSANQKMTTRQYKKAKRLVEKLADTDERFAQIRKDIPVKAEYRRQIYAALKRKIPHTEDLIKFAMIEINRNIKNKKGE